MKIIEKTRTTKTSDVIVIEDKKLKIKWFIVIEKMNGTFLSITESVNYELFKKQEYNYINKVYDMAFKAMTKV